MALFSELVAFWQNSGFSATWLITVISAAILTAFNCLLAYLNIRGGRWRGVAQAFEKERDAVKMRCDRLSTENRQLLAENGELRAKVDLTPIRDGLASLHHLTAEQYTQTGKALTEITRVLLGIEQRLAAFSGDVLPPRR